MTIYTVFVKDSLNHKFIDTSWARREAAEGRVAQLEASMEATGFKGGVWIVEMRVEDVEIGEKRSRDIEGRENPGPARGGKARAERLTPEERSDIASHAAEVRWSKKRETEPVDAA